jgi:hypothetical protein
MTTVRTSALGPGQAITMIAAATSRIVRSTWRTRSPADRPELKSRVSANAASTKQKIANSASAVPMVTPGQIRKTRPRTSAMPPRQRASLRVSDGWRENMRPILGPRRADSNTRDVSLARPPV